MRSHKLILLITLAASTFCNAQYTDVINSNRPGISKSAFAVGKNVVQFETGIFTVKQEHTPLNYEVSGFGLDFSGRYGLLFEQLEVSIDGRYQNDKILFRNAAIPVESKRANFSNLTIGAKYLVHDPYKDSEVKTNVYSYFANRKFSWKSLIPAVSVYLGGNYDTTDNPYTAVGVEGFSPKLMVATQHNFSGGWVFVTNLIKDRIGTDSSDFQYIITLTHSFSPKWVIFGETQGIKSDFYADNLFRLGGAYLWSKNLQFDTNVAFNTKNTPSVFNFAFGASYRLDFHDESLGGSDFKTKGTKRKNRKSNNDKRKGFDN